MHLAKTPQSLVLALLLVLVSAGPAAAAPTEPYLLANLLGWGSETGDSNPEELYSLGARAVFVADVNLVSGLWSTDGTSEGTFRLCGELGDADCLSFSRSGSTRILFSEGTHIYFLARTLTHGGELYRTDGTPEGTIRLTDFPGLNSTVRSRSLVLYDAASEFLYFRVDAIGPPEADFPGLWRTDGRREGTIQLLPGSNVALGTVFQGRAIFAAEDPNSGREVWHSDGTPAGTSLLHDLDPGSESSFPIAFQQVGNSLAFIARDPVVDPNVSSSRVWISDGARGGVTALVLPESSILNNRRRLFPAGNHLYFVTREGEQRSLWVWKEETRQLEILVTLGDAAVESFTSLSSGRALFEIRDGLNTEIWSSDGSSQGTRRIDSCSEPCRAEVNTLRMTRIGESLAAFALVDPSHGRELWLTDGTSAGTQLVDICPGSCSGLPFGTWIEDERISRHEGSLLFVAFDGISQKLWSTDGTPDGTRSTPLPTADLVTFYPPLPMAESNRMLFVADHVRVGTEPWSAPLSLDRCELVRDLQTNPDDGSSPHDFTLIDDRMAFVATGEDRAAELWLTDGTPAGTLRVHQQASSGGRQHMTLFRVRDEIWFTTGCADVEHCLELWISRGTPNSTRRLLRTGFDRLGDLTLIGNRVFFHNRSHLWLSDGTEEGTRRLTKPVDISSAWIPLRGRVYFRGGFRGELWVSDGTEKGTGPFLVNGEPIVISHHLIRHNGLLYFVEEGEDGNGRLWSTDGTTNGTRPLFAFSDVFPADAFLESLHSTNVALLFELSHDGLWSLPVGQSARPLQLADFTSLGDVESLGDHFYFWFFDSQETRLWQSDGTPSGTRPVSFQSGFPGVRAIHSLGDQLAVSVHFPPGDRRLWITDGTEENTFLVGDFDTFEDFNRQSHFSRLGNRIVFAADRDGYGLEPWVFALSDDGPAPAPTGPPAAPTNLEARALPNGGIQLTWQDRSHNESVFRIDLATDGPSFRPLSFLPPNTETLVLEDPLPGRVHAFRLRAENPEGASTWSAPAIFQEEGPDQCTPGDQTLCLLNRRFRVTADWRDPRSGDSGTGQAAPFDFSDDSGIFWFFQPDNLELVVKVLDAGTVNGNFWFFHGAISDVEYTITVTDLATGRRKEYFSPAGETCGEADVTAFPKRDTATFPESLERLQADVSTPPDRGVGPCFGTTTLCLNDAFTEVTVEWTDPRSGDSGRGVAIPGTDDSGFFWFFDEENVELVIKVLDARQVNGHYWFFAGGLTDLEYKVTLVHFGNMTIRRTYTKPAGDLCSLIDVTAF